MHCPAIILKKFPSIHKLIFFYNVIFFVGHLVNLLIGYHVHLHVGRHVSHRNVVSMFCEGSETLTEWKSESVMDRRRTTDWLG